VLAVVSHLLQGVGRGMKDELSLASKFSPNPLTPFPGKEGGGTVGSSKAECKKSDVLTPPSFPGKGDGGLGKLALAGFYNQSAEYFSDIGSGK